MALNSRPSRAQMLADMARRAEAQAEPGALAPGAGADTPDGAGLESILLKLRSGQIPASALLQLLALLSGMGAGGLQAPVPQQEAAPEQSPIEAAMMGQ